MNIQTVIANVMNLIESKEKLLASLPADDSAGYSILKSIFETNVQELNTILNDCMAVREADIVRNLEAKERDQNTGWEH